MHTWLVSNSLHNLRRNVSHQPRFSGTLHFRWHPSSKWVYMVSEDSNNALIWFTRAKVGGKYELTFGGSKKEGVDPRTVVLSPDGLFLYVTTGGSSSTVQWWSVNQATGEPTYVNKVADSSSAQSGGKIRDPNGIVISHDGKNVYVSSYSDKYMTSFARDSGTGALTYLGKVFGSESQTYFYQPLGIAISPDDKQ